MERTAWTDERLDDLVARVDNQFELLRSDIAEFRTEIRSELRETRRDMFHGFITVFGSQVAIFAVLLADRL